MFDRLKGVNPWTLALVLITAAAVAYARHAGWTPDQLVALFTAAGLLLSQAGKLIPAQSAQAKPSDTSQEPRP